ncbi:CDP-diacylglycerol--glycerol-3-phosphate 3-phosphatidyltransferase [Saccharomonospora piscinae]|uniref:CDP-diacylglycerol--glycerol-3-phosphate 3-phosphatidyltransferase n=1 Tax=Saccharomonospora piscinae TaxID=687388 RepID=A0A1V9AAF9_SACPI|nr:CDP-diacylglycerol--glycerol-3-phosphate 3-phosphatidyltransferase [Saccharomonospora piscinae]OQO94083.1 CDP-diacylglycerol--glycerol-3-phosphate 3-phosphatidyltransferase [Saccharomonospora piscinae]TLW95257.1 CDP-diacylglycerol--glycerol-3-phosphate 3-phosphatidyltransferase [Saccharomonospora piscinae]
MSGDRADGAGPPGGHVSPAVPTLNVANVLTVLRLVLVPVFVLALFAAAPDGAGEDVDLLWRYVAVAVFALAAMTDRVDGWVARRYGLVTDFGKVADPIADKALIGAALVGLSVLGELAWWVTGVILGRELAVTLLRFWVIRHGVIPASKGGKAKTLAQVLAIGAVLLPLPSATDPAEWALIGLALVLTVVTGADYVVRALRLRAGATGAPAAPGGPGDTA